MADKKPKKTTKKKAPKQEPKAIVPMGTPTKFKPEYVDMLLTFFEVEPYYKDELENHVVMGANGKPREAKVKYTYRPNKLPTLFGFARSIGVAYSTVWRWAERGEDPELQQKLEDHIAGKIILPESEISKLHGLKNFCNAYKEAKELQKEFLINIGLAGAAPPAAFIFTAKNVAGMRDEKHLNHEVENNLANIIAAANGDRKKPNPELSGTDKNRS